LYYIYILQQNIRKTTCKIRRKLAMVQLRHLEIAIDATWKHDHIHKTRNERKWAG